MFFVRVPVLSVNKNCIQPSSSTLLVFLTSIYGSSVSLLISKLYFILAKSRLIFIEIGITQESIKNALSKYTHQSSCLILMERTNRLNENTNNIKKNSLVILLTSLSVAPYLVLAFYKFYYIQHSFPEYMTMPITSMHYRVMFCQIVFCK